MSGKKITSTAEKVRSVLRYLRGEISMSGAAEMAGIDGETFRNGVRNYEADGADAFLPHKNRMYSPELKRQAVEEYLSGEGSLNDFCKKYYLRSKMQLQT